MMTLRAIVVLRRGSLSPLGNVYVDDESFMLDEYSLMNLRDDIIEQLSDLDMERFVFVCPKGVSIHQSQETLPASTVLGSTCSEIEIVSMPHNSDKGGGKHAYSKCHCRRRQSLSKFGFFSCIRALFTAVIILLFIGLLLNSIVPSEGNEKTTIASQDQGVERQNYDHTTELYMLLHHIVAVIDKFIQGYFLTFQYCWVHCGQWVVRMINRYIDFLAYLVQLILQWPTSGILVLALAVSLNGVINILKVIFDWRTYQLHLTNTLTNLKKVVII